MPKPIRRVAVLGAGVMGSGIAAHAANAGLEVLLLDMVPRDLDPARASDPAARNQLALAAIARLVKAKPAPLYHHTTARRIRPGNLEDDFEALAHCDLVIEAVIERLDIKRSLFERLEAALPATTLIASNTSGLRIADMLEGRSTGFQQRFAVLHFFNPPRYMKLLEVVAGAETDPEVLERLEHFGREILGKGIVRAKDAPNFVANRVGAHSMMATIHAMLELKLAPEDIDAIAGLPMGRPKSAIFRTGDMVGIDTLVSVVDNCYAVLEDDEDRDVFEVPAYIRAMIDKGFLGQKSGSGFYRKTKAGIETLDPYTGEYRAKGGDAAIQALCKKIAKEPDPRERVRKLVAAEGPVGEVGWRVLSRSMAYAARRIGEITDDLSAVDNGMRWGYNWELGPFEIWDALGFTETTDRMLAEGIELPEEVLSLRQREPAYFYGERGEVFELSSRTYRQRVQDPRETTFEILRRGEGPVIGNAGADAWDLGDGVLGVTFKTKANSIDADVIDTLHRAVDRAETEFRALVIANRGDHFCVGANLFVIAMAAGQKKWDEIRETVRSFQEAGQRLKYAAVPTVAAPYGRTLGGGLEICLACDAVQASAETYTGLVEPAVGLIPGGGGTLNLLWRALEGVPEGVEIDTSAFVNQVFKNIAMVKVAESAVEAQELGYFRRSDGVTFDDARLLDAAKKRAIAMAEVGYHAPIPRAHRLPGESGIATLEVLVSTMIAAGYATEHDGVIARALARVLCGGAGGAARDVTEEEILELEREAFLSLCGEAKTQERMQHMLMQNRPLRN
jgi:3-hydroxyacyl-CoA dehydrogenase